MTQALLIIDVQNDFLPPDGALAVPDGEDVIAPINELLASDRFGLVIATRDWHPPDHHSFKAQGGPWPEHCVQDTAGAQLDARLNRDAIDAVIDTGMGSTEGYSAFETGELRELLREEQVSAVTIVGLATDVCVKHTAADALRETLAVTIPSDAVRGIDAQDTADAVAELAAAGAEIQ